MKNWLKLAEKWLRFKAPTSESWADRSMQEQLALSGLREHPGFPAFQDALDADLANLFFLWLRTESTQTHKLRELHARGLALQRVIRLLDDTTLAKSRIEEIEQQYAEAERILSAHQTHNARRQAAMSMARASAET